MLSALSPDIIDAPGVYNSATQRALFSPSVWNAFTLWVLQRTQNIFLSKRWGHAITIPLSRATATWVTHARHRKKKRSNHPSDESVWNTLIRSTVEKFSPRCVDDHKHTAVIFMYSFYWQYVSNVEMFPLQLLPTVKVKPKSPNCFVKIIHNAHLNAKEVSHTQKNGMMRYIRVLFCFFFLQKEKSRCFTVREHQLRKAQVAPVLSVGAELKTKRRLILIFSRTAK